MKESTKNSINNSDNIKQKLDHLYFLTILHYYEIKYHNQLIEEKQKEKKESLIKESEKSKDDMPLKYR